MRVQRAQLTRALVHALGETDDAAGIIAREAARDVVGAFDEERAQQIDPPVTIAWSYVELHRLGHRVDCFNHDYALQVAALGHDQCRQQFFRARRRP